MSKAYGNSNKSTGRTASINKHPGSNKDGTSDNSFSATRQVDANAHILQTKANMAAVPKHQPAQGLNSKVPYARQSHAVRPSGPIQSFVGNRVDGSPGELPTVKRPGVGGTGYYPKDKKGS
jgi:hypothetical protein